MLRRLFMGGNKVPNYPRYETLQITLFKPLICKQNNQLRLIGIYFFILESKQIKKITFF